MDNFITRLAYLGVIEITGDDASSFLQAQFTSDIDQLPDRHSQFSAWCNAAGRVIASFIITRTADRYYLILPVDILNAVCRRLKMYVLRARVSLVDMTDSHHCLGTYMPDTATGLDELINWDYSSIKVPVPNDPARAILITAKNEVPSFLAGIAAHGIKITTDGQWLLQDIAAGIPWIYTQTSEQALPQELNLESLGGLSYNKGCYPGQEIIARLHFRGRQKRSLCTAYIETAGPVPVTGAKLPGQTDTQSAGSILYGVRESEGLVRILAVIDTEQAGTDSLALGDGELLHFSPVSPQADTR